MCHQKRGQIGGRDSLGDCDNICEGNLVFRVIFGNFIHRWFQICAQLGSYNVYFSHYRPPKLKYDFFRGSFSQPTSKSKWVGEPDYKNLAGSSGDHQFTSLGYDHFCFKFVFWIFCCFFKQFFLFVFNLLLYYIFLDFLFLMFEPKIQTFRWNLQETHVKFVFAFGVRWV